MTARPNVLFFFADDQRFDTIAALGNPRIRTPNIDGLVTRGTAFTHGYIPGGTSGAVCMPSRAMLHSGRTLFHIESAGQAIPTAHTLMGEHLRAHGYRTFGTGKWHNGTESYARSFSEGAEIFFGGMEDHWNVPACRFDPAGMYTQRLPKSVNPFHAKRECHYVADHVSPGKHSSELFCDAAIEFLQTCDNTAPFFAYVAFMAPHDPRVMPREFRKLYGESDIPFPQSFVGEHPFDYGVRHIRDEKLADYPRTECEIREHIADYYGMITHLDAQMGRVLSVLEKRGLADSTIVVFAGDNGLAVGSHGLMGKQNLYEHSIRVPLILAGPGVPKGTRVDAFALLLDVFPTLAELLGLDRPDSVEGKSLVPAMRDGTEVREKLYLAYTDKVRGIRTREYKLIEYRTEDLIRTQLFNLEDDPEELRDLSQSPSHRETIDSLRERLFELRDDCDDCDSAWGRTFWARY